MAGHSSIVGGSTAARVLACPGSVVANLRLPPAIAITNEYAEEGTFYHEVMTRLMRARQGDPKLDLYNEAEKWIGKTVHDRMVTRHHLDEGVFPALARLQELEDEYGNAFRVMAVEKSVKFPGLADCYGTVDLILRNPDTVLHVDWKFGQGVPVRAWYPLPDDEIEINKQLMFYLTAAIASLGKLVYEPEDILVVAIIQPRIEEAEQLTHGEVYLDEIAFFKKQLQRAVKTALAPGAPRKKGEWCRWAPCKLTCPLWTGPLLDAATFKMVPSLPDDQYGRHLANAKALLDAVAILKTEVDNQLHTYLSSGGRVPGWRLKEKVSRRREWIDEATVEKALRKLGMKRSEIFREKLLTFEMADAWAKRKKKVIPEHLRILPPSSGTTVAREDDPAPDVSPITALEQFRASFTRLTGCPPQLTGPEYKT